jgi:hypothetical protein
MAASQRERRSGGARRVPAQDESTTVRFEHSLTLRRHRTLVVVYPDLGVWARGWRAVDRPFIERVGWLTNEDDETSE